jgi:hypothetical protein
METDATDATGTGGKRGPTNDDAPWDVLFDGIATANRAAIVHAEEMRRLQTCVIFGAILLASIYVLRGNHGTH